MTGNKRDITLHGNGTVTLWLDEQQDWIPCSLHDLPDDVVERIEKHLGNDIQELAAKILTRRGYRGMTLGDGTVIRRIYVTAPLGYTLNTRTPVPGWEDWIPCEVVPEWPRTRVLLTRRESLTLNELRMIETWSYLDDLASQRGLREDPAGPGHFALSAVRNMQRWALQVDPRAEVDSKRLLAEVKQLTDEQARVIRAYAVALSDPDKARKLATDFDCYPHIGEQEAMVHNAITVAKNLRKLSGWP